MPGPLVPTVDEVGALLHARTSTGGGGYAGTFTDDTFPTGTQVAVLCEIAASDLQREVGLAIVDACATDARRVAAYRAAVLVETSYFLDEEDSAARRTYSANYIAGVATVKDCADSESSGETPDDGVGGHGDGFRVVRVVGAYRRPVYPQDDLL